MVAVVPSGLFHRVRDVGRGRRRRRIEQVLQDPFAAKDGRSARGIRRDRQDAGLCENAAAMRIGREIDAAELAALDVRNAVEGGQALIQERVIGVDEIEDGAVVANDGLKEELGSRCCMSRRSSFVELGELSGIGLEAIEIADLEPLAAEVVDESARLRIEQHAVDLRVQDFADCGGGAAAASWKSSSSGMLLHRK